MDAEKVIKDLQEKVRACCCVGPWLRRQAVDAPHLNVRQHPLGAASPRRSEGSCDTLCVAAGCCWTHMHLLHCTTNCLAVCSITCGCCCLRPLLPAVGQGGEQDLCDCVRCWRHRGAVAGLHHCGRTEQHPAGGCRCSAGGSAVLLPGQPLRPAPQRAGRLHHSPDLCTAARGQCAACTGWHHPSTPLALSCGCLAGHLDVRGMLSIFCRWAIHIRQISQPRPRSCGIVPLCTWRGR